MQFTAAMNTLSVFFFPLPPSLLVNVMTVVSSVVVAVIGFRKREERICSIQSSGIRVIVLTKSSNSEQLRISSRLGMLLLYTPAVLTGAASFWFLPNDDLRVLLLKSALTLHFFKRDFEVLFVHKYSGKMVIDSALIISLSYFSSTALMIYAQQQSKALPEPTIDLKNIGIAVFVIGIIGNMYHHILLSQTRKKGETGYKIPKGGLFGIIICPHYLFEITVYFGFALISQTFYAFFFAIATAIYLGGRSYATRKWYVSKFEDFPQHIKALIPFVF